MKKERFYIFIYLVAILFIAACSRTDEGDKLPGEVDPPTVAPPSETIVPVQMKVLFRYR